MRDRLPAHEIVENQPVSGRHHAVGPNGRRFEALPGMGPFGRPATRWESRYRWAVIGSDLLATVLSVLVVGSVVTRGHGPLLVPVDLAVLTILVVTATVALNRGWHPNVLGQGAEEFRRLGKGLAAAVVIMALGGLALNGLGGNLRDMRQWVFA